MKNTERHGRVDFLPVFVQVNMETVANIQQTFTSSNEPFFLNTFSPLVWILMFSLFVIFTFLKMLDRRFPVYSERAFPLTQPDATASWYDRFKYEIWKLPLLRRLRIAAMNVGTLSSHSFLISSLTYFLMLTCLRLYSNSPSPREIVEIFIASNPTPKTKGNSTRQWVLNIIIALCGLFFVLIYESTMTYVTCHQLVHCSIIGKSY